MSSVDEEIVGSTHVAADGLYIPYEYREFTAQVVFRTPRATIQHFQSGGGELDMHYGMIDESHFGDPEEMYHSMNPELAPDCVRIKPRGEDDVVLLVNEFDDESDVAGGLDG